MTTPPNPQENVELLIRKMRFLWFALLGSLVMYYALTLFVERPEDAQPNDVLFLVLVGISISTTLASFVIKKKLFAQAEEQQQVQLVQQGFIVAAALTEVAALLGVVDYFVTADRYYYVLFIIAACGQLLHFPRREPFQHATFKTSTF